MRLLTFFAVMLIAASTIAMAVPTVFHPAEQVAPGTFGGAFGSANFSFNGSVGIGTTNPDQVLHLNSSGATVIHVQSAPGSDSGILIDRGNISANSGMALYTGGLQKWAVGMLRDTDNFVISLTGSSSEFSINRSTGYVGIGTTAITQKLTVNGSVNVSGTVYASNISSNSPLQLQAGGTTRIFVNDTTGYIGIGTATPSSLLSVQGSSYFVGAINATGGMTLNSVTKTSWPTTPNECKIVYASASGVADCGSQKAVAGGGSCMVSGGYLIGTLSCPADSGNNCVSSQGPPVSATRWRYWCSISAGSLTETKTWAICCP